MKKRVLFSLLAIFLAGLGLGGVSMAASCDGDYVAKNTKDSETCYNSLATAISEAPDGSIVTLLKDTTIAEDGVISVDKTITLNMDGNKITYTPSNTVTNNTYVQLITVEANGNLTIDGNGIIEGPTNGATFDGKVIISVSGGTLTYLNGTLTAHGAGSDGMYGVYILENGTAIFGNENDNTGPAITSHFAAIGENHMTAPANITIYGGTYTAIAAPTSSEWWYYFCAPLYAAGAGTIDIQGGTFNGYYGISDRYVDVVQTMTIGDNVVLNASSDTQIFVDSVNGSNGESNRTIVSNSNTITIPDTYGWFDINGVYNLFNADSVAVVGNTQYNSLSAAITAASAGDTVEILKAGTYSLPATISVANLTIKGNVDGVVLTHSYSDGGIISQIVGPITFENVKFILTDNTNNTSAHYFQSNNITFTNCIIEGLLFGYGTMIFNNCVFEQSVYAYNMWTWRGDITYNDCTFHNTYSSYFINVYHWLSDPNDRHVITINSGVFTTENQGVGAKVKAAVNIKEAENNGNTSVALQFTINLNNITTHGTFLTTGWGGSEKYQVDDLLGETTKIDGIDGGTPSYGTVNGGDVVVTLDGTTVYSTPKRDTNRSVTFQREENLGESVLVPDGGKVAIPSNPTKSCYSFNGWYNGSNLYDFDSVVKSDLILNAQWTYVGCGGGGGSSSTSSSSNSSSNNKPSDTAGSGNTNTGTVVPTVDPQGVAANGYTNEMNEAYEFAYANGITTMKSIDEAEMLDGLTRIAMAKMLSQYAINVLGKSPADVEVPNFVDVSADLDAEYANGVTLAYKLGIMGINMPDNKFLPYETVTRAQFGTALSRLLFGIEDGEDAYYSTHLKKLKEAGIITNDDPTLEELRGYVMLMLMRSSKGSNTVSTSTEPAVSNENTNTSAHEVANEPKEEQEVEAYFTEAYRKGQIYGRIGDLQRLLKSLGYYNGDINNTFDNNTIDAVFDFQIAMGILPADDKSSARGNVGPKTRDVLNQKWAEFNK